MAFEKKTVEMYLYIIKDKGNKSGEGNKTYRKMKHSVFEVILCSLMISEPVPTLASSLNYHVSKQLIFFA